MDEYESTTQPVSPTPVGPPPGYGPPGNTPPGYAPPGYAPPGSGPAGQPQFALPAGAVSEAQPQKTRWRDVIFGWRSAVALFAAGLVLGGLGGAAITVVADHHGDSSPTINRFPGGGFAPGGGFGPYSGQSGTQGDQSEGQTS